MFEGTPQVDLGSETGPLVELQPMPLRLALGSWFLPLLAGLGSTISMLLVLAIEAPELQWMLAGSVLVVAVVAAALLIRRSRSRTWLRPHQLGLMLQRGGRTSVIVYSAIHDLTLDDREMLDNGAPVGRDRRLVLRHSGGRLFLRQAFMTAGEDHYAVLLDQLVAAVADAVEARIGGGGVLTGKGWLINAMGLRIGSRAESLPLSEVAWLGRFQHRFCLWRRGESRPFLVVPRPSRNAVLLAELAGRQITEDPTAAPADPLGRLLFVRRGPLYWLWLLSGLIALATLGASGVIFWQRDRLTDELLAALLFLVMIGLLLAVATVLGAVARHEFYQAGIVQRGLFGRSELLWSELRAIAYSTDRRYIDGTYSHTSYKLRLEPATGGRLRLAGRSRGSDEDLAALVRHISTVVHRMEELEQEAGRERYTVS